MQEGRLWPHIGKLDRVADRFFEVLPRTRYRMLEGVELDAERAQDEARETAWNEEASGRFDFPDAERARRYR